MEIHTNRGFPRHLEKPREPRSALPHFSQAGAVLHIQPKTEGNGNGRSRKRFVTISMSFGSCSAPHPSLNLTGHEPTIVNRTARGYSSVSSAAISNRVGNLRGLRFAAGRASIRVWCRHVCKPDRETKPGTRYRWRCFLFADLCVVRFFSAEEIFVS